MSEKGFIPDFGKHPRHCHMPRNKSRHVKNKTKLNKNTDIKPEGGVWSPSGHLACSPGHPGVPRGGVGGLNQGARAA